MSKIKTSKTKKVVEVKEKQKISSFFKKIDTKKESEYLDNDFKVKTIGSEPKHNETKNVEKNYKTDAKVSSKNEIKEKDTLKEPQVVKSPKKQSKTKNGWKMKIAVLNDSDDDFVTNNLEIAKTSKEVKSDSNTKNIASKPSKIAYPEVKKDRKNVSKSPKIKNGQADFTAAEEELFNEIMNLPETKKSVAENQKPNLDVNKLSKNKNRALGTNVKTLPKSSKGSEKNFEVREKEPDISETKTIVQEVKEIFEVRETNSKWSENNLEAPEKNSDILGKKLSCSENLINNISKMPEHKVLNGNTNLSSKIDESNLVVNLDSVDPNDISPRTLLKPLVTPEKSYLKCDEILHDITNSKGLDSLLADVKLIKSCRKNSPPHSTPVANLKKRKSPEKEFIPQTPEDEQKPKSKLRLESKFNKQIFNKKPDEIDIPDFIVSSPPKKIRKIITEPKIIVNLSEINENQFRKLHETNFGGPVKEIITIDDISILDTPSKDSTNLIPKKSPRKMDKENLADIEGNPQKELKSPKTPTEIISSFTSPTRSPKKNSKQNAGNNSPSKWSSKLKSPVKFLEQKIDSQSSNVSSKNPQKDTDSLMDYFKNLPSSCEEKRGIEISSDFIVTKKPEQKFDFDDLNFEESWDIDVNDLEINNLDLEKWQYCKVTNVSTDLYQNVILKLESVNEAEKSSVILQGVWKHLVLKNGDRVSVLAQKCSGNVPFSVNNDFGFVVYEPDTLISGTSIVGSLFCKRKGVLSEKFRGFDSENKFMLIGSIVHRLLQESLKRKLKTVGEIEKVLVEILAGKDLILSCYATEVPIHIIKSETLPFVQKVHDFISSYVYINGKKDKQNWNGAIESIQDIEENIWSYNYGIKGKVDVTLRTKKDKINQYSAFSNAKTVTLPLELKTGRASFSLEHRGQIILYTMIMTELGYNVNSGLLLYLREGVLKEIEAKHIEKRDLIMLRNELAYFLNKKAEVPGKNQKDNDTASKISKVSTKSENVSPQNEIETASKISKVSSKSENLSPLTFCELPEPINHHSACKRCPYATICTTFLSNEPNCLSEGHPLQKLSTEILSHLTEEHRSYFIKWASLIHIESNYKPPIKELKDIWRSPAVKRESLGKSLCYLEIFGEVTDLTEPYMHHFRRSQDSEILKIIKKNNLMGDFLNSGLTIGNYVIVSSENRVAIASGFISKITKDEIVIGLERNLFERYSNKKFHVDTYESQTIYNMSLANIATLLENSPKSQRLRELIIDKRVPEFASKLSKTVAVVGEKILKRLNKNQQRAVLKVLASNDYLLIKGMPGTGKTATIVALIQLLVGLKKTVLITSHTNSAVDNVCLRLLDCGIDVLRLGSDSRIHPMLKCCSERAKTSHCKTVEDLETVFNQANVIATTCLGANHPLLSKRTLDVCLVDESTQVLQCSVFKALLSTKTFVLIGDPEQLPPIVSNPEALLRGMNESLFERLTSPENTITLSLQYRMNKVVANLANNLTYKGQLMCADDTVGYAILRLPRIERIQALYFSEPWLLQVLDTNIDNSVIGIDTGPTWKKIGNNVLDDLKVPVQNIQEDEDRNYDNSYEVAITCAIVEALKEAGLQSESIGIIAPYRTQVEHLKKVMKKIDEKFLSKDRIEVNTVDQYQGRDKEVIIYSCTKSRDTSKIKNKSAFEILEDKRRLTVAITRAKHKLILIGDFCTLKTYTPFEVLLNSLEPHQVLPLAYESKGFSWDKVMEKLKSYET